MSERLALDEPRAADLVYCRRTTRSMVDVIDEEVERLFLVGASLMPVSTMVSGAVVRVCRCRKQRGEHRSIALDLYIHNS